MSDNNWQKQPQYKTGLEQSNVESAVANTVGGVKKWFRGTPFGSTQFDDTDLNAMIDLVEHANPEHLEMAGKALWDARDAVSTASSDLHKNIQKVLADWEGEGAKQFHTWTQALLIYTKELETYAHNAGTHISTAATGLASVRKSMPPRDTRPAAEQKLPSKLPKAKQVDSNPDYVLAKKVEKDRQDAINQMVRLGSYYSVAATGLQTNPEPKPIKAIPDVGVVKPVTRSEDRRPYESGTGTSNPRAAIREGVAGGHGTTPTPHRTVVTGGDMPPLKEVHEPSAPSGHDVGTEINTTTTLPPQAPAAPPTSPVPTLPTTAGGGGQTPPMPPGPMAPPVAPTAGRNPGYGPTGRLPVTAQGRTGPLGTGGGRVPQGPTAQPGRAVSGGRVPQGPGGQTGRSVPGGRVPQGPTGQPARATGRTTPTGQPGARGPVQSGRTPLGRAVTGGTSKTTNTPGGRTGVTGPTAPTRNGVVGGKPVTGRTPGGTPGPRVPRGTVVGAEKPASSMPQKGALGQRGVVGTPTANAESGAGQAVLRSAGNPEGVIGSARSSAKGSDSSGAGIGRGAVGNRQGANGGAGRKVGAAEKEQSRPTQQRREVPKTSD
ncbi:hypothetical protein GCM10010503_68530 [Streptomyces lucensis JCM 4490]|uniref:Uncharacterized protein n=1 Tax=Streptomyces lucensis JCM 4490 TaxID=1306176 RepID=A0A918MYB9_9ACTN|nr:hypothetical protein [Streptomyces lucensis]GGW81457.1 hypothetical protein GCM10010503_68530 [Streptomyces lucensis JCM 4490]